MRTAIYTRVSTEEQAKEGYSIDAQESRLKDFASSQGWIVTDMYVDDGQSAKDLDRPEMKRLIRDIKKKKIDVVLVYKLDRLVRSVLNLHELLELFDKHDVKFRSATEMFDTTSAMGRFFITLVGAMAQWERENLAERVKVGMEQKALSGERNGSYAPFGYTLQSDGTLVKDPEEGKLLQRIFDMYRNNTGIASIVKQLNTEQKVKRARGGKTKRWVYSTVYYILQNPVYCGQIRWGSQGTGDEIITEGTHEPYISREEFDELQQIRKGRGGGTKKIRSDFVFAGILRCSRCGYGLTGTSFETKTGISRHYRCTGRTNYGVCDMPRVSESKLEAAFLEDWATQIGALHMPNEQDEEEMNAITIRLKEIEEELSEVKGRKKEWIRAFGKKAITLEELQEFNKEDNELEEALKEEAISLEARNIENKSGWDLEQMNHSLRAIQSVWPQITDVQAKKNFLQEVFKSITIGIEDDRPSIIDFEPRIHVES